MIREKKNPPAKDTSTSYSNLDRIVKIAADLFAKHGYHATGMSDLERETGLGRGSLYYHITSKEELLFEVTSRYLRLLIEAGTQLLGTEMPAEERLRKLSRYVMRTVTNHQSELTVCFREMHSVVGIRRTELLNLHRQYEQIWADTLEAGKLENTFRPTSSLTVKALLGMHHYSYLWLRSDSLQSPEDIADYFCDLALSGISADSYY